MLPDEIISQILSPALTVSDELFSDTSDVSPFAQYSPSTSAYLVVCKRWLRVATPLLYKVVVLRSKGQADALEQVLRDNPEFGLFIKKLRVEGGYGLALHTILQSAKDITDVSLSLSTWSSDNSRGLCKGLPLINPHRVIVVDPIVTKRPLKNKHQLALMEALFQCIGTWSNLSEFVLPYPSSPPLTWSTRVTEVAQALVKSKTLRTVIIPKTYTNLPYHFHVLFKIPALQTVQLRSPFVKTVHQHRLVVEKIDSDPRLKALVRYTMLDDSLERVKDDDAMPDIAPSLNPSFVPMESAPVDTQDTVWNRVFFFAMSNSQGKAKSSRLSVLLVSKRFSRLALPHIYHHINLKRPDAAPISRQIQRQPQLGPSIRVLEIPYQHENTIAHNVISSATRVEKFSGILLAEHFELLARTTGSTLREVSVTIPISTPTATISAAVFAHFPELRILKLSAPSVIFASAATSENALEKLHTLHMLSNNQTFLNAASSMRLASLHTFRSQDGMQGIQPLTNFLRAHGGHILHASFGYMFSADWEHLGLSDTCIALLDVEFTEDFDFNNLTSLTCNTPHGSLTKIIVGGDLDADFVNEIDLAMFPALREIRCSSLQWPTTERAISKSDWVPLAESLLEKNVKLTDSTGKHWIPRVKSTRRAG
ncbi:hypothetical protein C8R43DRAFT_1078514 [Mycena crocata]|nr:hypothetical protein C8R43DRAFT_1078514 [Mycena crocata]